MVRMFVNSEYGTRAAGAFADGVARTAAITLGEMSILGEKIATKLRENTPVATGRLANSTRSELSAKQANLVVVTIVQTAMNRGVFYRPFVVRGTKPHKVPPSELEEYVRLKFSLARPLAIKKAAFALSKKIAVEGTPPNPYTQNTLIEMLPEIRDTSRKIGRGISVALTDPFQTSRRRQTMVSLTED